MGELARRIAIEIEGQPVKDGRAVSKDEALEAAERVVRMLTVKPEAVYVVFDGPPGAESGRFVEVETRDGRGAANTNVDWEPMATRQFALPGAPSLWRLGPFFTRPSFPQAAVEAGAERGDVFGRLPDDAQRNSYTADRPEGLHVRGLALPLVQRPGEGDAEFEARRRDWQERHPAIGSRDDQVA